MRLRVATDEDVPLLATMNRALIEDEGSRNPMSMEELRARMTNFLADGWTAILVLEEDAVVGYLLYRAHPAEYDATRSEVFLRQLFVVRERRRQGIGRWALAEAVARHFPGDADVVLDVLVGNEGAERFWRALGFEPYAITLRRSA